MCRYITVNGCISVIPVIVYLAVLIAHESYNLRPNYVDKLEHVTCNAIKSFQTCICIKFVYGPMYQNKVKYAVCAYYNVRNSIVGVEQKYVTNHWFKRLENQHNTCKSENKIAPSQKRSCIKTIQT